MDKIGSILYSVGGTAYNIAINLAQSGVPVSLLTVLKKNSFSSTWICERLKSTGVDFDLIDFSEKVRESGFVALRTDGVLNTAVTSTAVGEHSFPPHLIDQAVLNARIVVIDCNLATDQMSLLLNCAMKHNRPTVVAAVSDSKVLRLLQLEDHQLIDVVGLNELELKTAIGDKAVHRGKDACKRLHAKHVVVSEGKDGYRVLSTAGHSRHYPAPQVDIIHSASGAGDALLSGLVEYWYKNQTLEFDEAAPVIARSIRKVLEQLGSTRGSLATDIDFRVLARIATRDEPVWRRFLSPEMGVAATILGAILAVGGLLLSLKLAAPPTPPSDASVNKLDSKGAASKPSLKNEKPDSTGPH